MSMPVRVDELTPEWLSAALSVRSPGTVVESVEGAFCPPEMQDADDCAEKARRHVSAALDYDTLSALGL